jgi:hypothetical protein
VATPSTASVTRARFAPRRIRVARYTNSARTTSPTTKPAMPLAPVPALAPGADGVRTSPRTLPATPTTTAAIHRTNARRTGAGGTSWDVVTTAR